ncbi:MAG: AtpZ/AtpI family protein [Bacteroidales bacterium]|jgi:F0F1-type ATP synthase assembly protein I|nr:AtpZ/AtpI family protein [Bacteroidales bacterium]
MDLSPEKKKKSLDNYTRYSNIAFQMLVIILIGVFGGIKLDEWLNLTIPVFTIILSILAVILSIYTVTRDLMKPTRGPGKKDPEPK